MNDPILDRSVPAGSPKSTDRRTFVIMIGVVTAIVLALIAFVALSDFPAPSESADDISAASSNRP